MRWNLNCSSKSSDGNKKVKDIEWRIIMNKNGFLTAVMVTVTHIHDSKAIVWLMKILRCCYAKLRVTLIDDGYIGETVKRFRTNSILYCR